MRQEYEAHGHVTVAGVLDASTVARLLLGLEAIPGAALRTAPLSDPWVVEITEDARLRGLAARLLGAPVDPFGCTYVVKAPRSGPPALWHQDGHPWQERLGGAAAITLWVALDPATSENGCLRVVPGSHREPLHPLRRNEDVPSLFGVELDPALVDEAAAEDVVLAAGDVSVHHPNLVHGSGPNRSPSPRRALAVRYRTLQV